MEWLEVHIDTNHAGLEPLEIFLSANGVDGVVIDDEQDFQSFLENNHQYCCLLYTSPSPRDTR